MEDLFGQLLVNKHGEQEEKTAATGQKRTADQLETSQRRTIQSFLRFLFCFDQRELASSKSKGVKKSEFRSWLDRSIQYRSEDDFEFEDFGYGVEEC